MKYIWTLEDWANVCWGKTSYYLMDTCMDSALVNHVKSMRKWRPTMS